MSQENVEAQPPPAKPSVQLDLKQYEHRVNALFESWEKEESPVDAIVAVSGKQDGTGNSRVGQLQLWLCNFLFPETVVFFVREGRRLLISSGPKKLAVMEQLAEVHGKDNVVLIRRQEGEEAVVDAFMALVGTTGKLGIFAAKGEEPKGNFAQNMETKLKEKMAEWPRQPVDVFIARLLAPVDKFSSKLMELSAVFSCRLLKEALMNRVVDILDREVKESHATIVSNVEKVLQDKKTVTRWRTKFALNMEVAECMYALVDSQSSGFPLRPGQDATTENLSLNKGCICVAVAGKYADVVTNVGRTLLLDATKEEKDLYTSCLSVQTAIIAAVKPGVTFSALFEVGAEKCRELDLPVPRAFGHALALEFRDAFFVVSERCTEKIIEGMVLNIVVSFSGKLKDERSYGMHLADSILVEADKTTCLTAQLRKDLKTVYYELQDEESKPASPAAGREAPGRAAARSERPRASRRVAAQQSTILSHEAMQEKQRVLRQEKFQELKQRFAGGSGQTVTASSKRIRRMAALHVYRDPKMFPKDLVPGRVAVDRANESILVPIYGQHVPFHISTIRNVMHTLEDDATHSLRINFVLPGQGTVGAKEEMVFPEPSDRTVFLKELTIKSPDNAAQLAYKQIQEIQKAFKSRDANVDLTAQQALQVNRGARRVMLKNLMFKTTGGISARRVIGSLEAHQNGLRYTAARVEPIDIIFSNVKHAFLQPAGKEFVVILHFHLHSAIMVNRKRAVDVQFFTETGSQIDDLDTRRGRSRYDPDEIVEEEREHARKEKVNNEFRQFAEAVQSMSRLRFEIPIKELSFFGIPGHANIRLMPTQSALMSITEWPVFVVSIEDVEIVSFERVMHGLRAFDMTIVFQDFARPVKTVASIPVDSMDVVKKWLNEMNIVWYESKTPLNWSFILKTIRGDVEGFLREGGFAFLDDATDAAEPTAGSGSQQPAEEEEEDDEDYNETDDDSVEAEVSDESSDESDAESDASSDEDSEEDDEDSEEEEGLSWDELETRAKNEDRKRGALSDDEDKPSRKRRRVS